jgi:MFS family permease
MGIFVVALAGILVGLSQTYLMIILSLVLMGMACGGYHPSAPPLISKTVEPRIRGRALGAHVIGGSSSYFLAPLIVVVIATGWG